MQSVLKRGKRWDRSTLHDEFNDVHCLKEGRQQLSQNPETADEKVRAIGNQNSRFVASKATRGSETVD